MTIPSLPGSVPQSPPLRESPPVDLHAKMTAWPTVTPGGGGPSAAGADDAATAGTAAIAGAVGVTEPEIVSTGAAVAVATAEGASAGRLGPSRTPASRGHAIPTRKPTAAMMPTRVHDG